MSECPRDAIGFCHPDRQASAPRREAVLLELIASCALAVSTIVAATVVSIGMARAGVNGVSPASESPYAVAMLVGLFLVSLGGLTAAVTQSRARPRRD